jgi:ribose-phosphate pyrophosphokinase
MMLFGLSETSQFAHRLARHLGVTLAAHEEREFPDGEFKLRSLSDVRGAHAVVCQSLAADASKSCADKLVRLLVFCGSLKDAGARQVTALLPYLAYWRKDRRTQPRDPVTTSYVARAIEAVGVDAVVTIDAHNQATFENAFRCRTDHVAASLEFAAHFAAVAQGAERIVVLSPDAGGAARARVFAAELGRRAEREVGLAFMEKHRSGGKVSGTLFAGAVRGALVIIYDDMISTGGTVTRAAAAAAERGAKAVHCAATHALLSAEGVRLLNEAPLESLAVMDTVEDVTARLEGLRCATHVLDSAIVFARLLSAWAGERDLAVEAD